ncbi:MAG: S41 family peptidase, partial [Planctomycetes bacterium]|nr:S41 family peptidase [Planctomycetota bacterium]
EDEGASLRALEVRQILTDLKGAGMADIWRGADRLIRMGPPAKRIIQKEIETTSIEGQLAGLRALIGLDSPTAAADRLLEIAADEKTAQEYRLAALELVGKAGEEDAEEGLLELLTSLAPEIRIGAARALWEIEGEHRQAAKQALREFLKASDPELRAQGALALAEMGDSATPGVEETLLDLRKEPGLRGKYADALYRNLKLNEAILARESAAEAPAARSNGLWKPLDEIRSLLKEKYDLLEDAGDEALRIGAARGMVQFPDDPHTTFMTPEEYSEFLHGSDGVDPSYGGIGAFIDTNDRENLRILRPMFNGPAWKADIQGGDIIVAVNGSPTRGKAQTEIIKEIKGPVGTEVILSIYREGWTEPRDVKVIRAKIVIPTVYSRLLPGGIGYLQIAQFAAETGKELSDQLKALEAQGLRGLVIDLRDNPGGLLQSVQEALTPFLKERELVCTAKGRIGRAVPYFSFRPDRPRGYPVTVLVNGNSASGSELMSGVLQHYSKSSTIGGAKSPYVDAVVLGTTTFGKGSMQSTYPLQTWPGESFVDEPRMDGEWEPGEPFTDRNGNNRWDPGEPFTDRATLDGRWNDAEPWQDRNGNGTRDPDESYTDENGDGQWNPKEEFEDANKNGQYDYGAAVKMSVARYYLPGGQNFTRKRVFDEEKKAYVTKGGVVPDIVVEQERLDVSDLVELRDLQEKHVFDEYVRTRWDAHKDLFRELAWLDGRDPSRYPDFDAFYDSMRTRLSKQEVRRGLRIAVRRKVSIERGEEILGDLSDDNVLLAGVRETLRRLGEDPESIPEYHSLSLNGTAK